MASECSSCKCPFDITKSKRTRRASSYVSNPEDTLTTDKVQQVEGETNVHVKLKQLIKVDVSEDNVKGKKDKSSRPLLSQHFADEKQLQLAVIKQPGESSEVLKRRGIVKRYVRALGHLLKSKRSRNHLEKPVVLRLTM